MRYRTDYCLISGLLVLAAGCSHLADIGLRSPRVTNIKPRVANIDFKGVDMAFDIDVDNPYPVAIRSPSFRYAVEIEETEFIRSESNVKIDLPARQVGTLTVPVRIQYADLWQLVRQLADKSEATYTLRGTFDFAAMDRTVEVPVTHSGQFPILRLPEIKATDVQIPEKSLGRAAVRLDAEVSNPNVFALGVDRMGYAVLLGEVRVGDITSSTPKPISAGNSGKVALSGQITGLGALRQLLAGKSLGQASISPTGTIQTPYGPVRLPD